MNTMLAATSGKIRYTRSPSPITISFLGKSSSMCSNMTSNMNLCMSDKFSRSDAASVASSQENPMSHRGSYVVSPASTSSRVSKSLGATMAGKGEHPPRSSEATKTATGARSDS